MAAALTVNGPKTNYQSIDGVSRVAPTSTSAADKKNMRIREQQPKMSAETWLEIFRAWPKTTLLIIGNEFCERFSYYGMRTILTLYLLNILRFSNDASTMFFNGFAVVAYTSPLFGSILADGYIGKFKTILFVSMFYAIGQVTLALSSLGRPGTGVHPWTDMVGLLIIALGTGGIKPCVSSFGGDQFQPYQEKMISLFFSVFYFSINAGAMISTFVGPIFRATPCFGQESCYPLAFGVPAVLMIVSTVIFAVGSFWYKKPPPKVNVFGEVYKVCKKALENRCRAAVDSVHAGDCLDRYFDTHNCARDAQCLELQLQKNNPQICQKRLFVADIKGLLKILVIFIPLPIFWSLYDQQGSRWMIQALQMDCRLWNDIMLLPDQMQTLNSVLILVFIPIFQVFVYPFVSLCVKLTPLRKMVAGGFVAALAFVVSASVQFQINKTLPDLPPQGRAFVSVMNAFDGCTLSVKSDASAPTKSDGSFKQPSIVLKPNQTLGNRQQRELLPLLDLPANSDVVFHLGYSPAGCGGLNSVTDKLLPAKVGYRIDGEGTFYLLVGPQGTVLANASTQKPMSGAGEFSLGLTLALDDHDYLGDLALCRVKNSQGPHCDSKRSEDFYRFRVERTQPFLTSLENGKTQLSKRAVQIYEYRAVRPGKWAVHYFDEKDVGKKDNDKAPLEKEAKSKQKEEGEEIEMKQMKPASAVFEIEGQGGVYTLALTGPRDNPKIRVFQTVLDNTVSILWQVPQIVVLTAAEILFSITGLEFAYSQAAPSMKSLVQALWLLTTALGNVLIVVITLVRFENMAYELLFYAGLMAVVSVVLALLAIFYYDYKEIVVVNDDESIDDYNNNNSSSSSNSNSSSNSSSSSNSNSSSNSSQQQQGKSAAKENSGFLPAAEEP